MESGLDFFPTRFVQEMAEVNFEIGTLSIAFYIHRECCQQFIQTLTPAGNVDVRHQDDGLYLNIWNLYKVWRVRFNPQIEI
jgi:hypothetical protein